MIDPGALFKGRIDNTMQLDARATDLVFAELLYPRALAPAWRLLEVFSLNDRPFDLRLRWDSGGGAGDPIRVTVARSTRVCVWSQGFRVSIANLATNGVNKIEGHIATLSEPIATHNFWETTQAIVADTVFTPPDMSRTVRFDCPIAAQAASKLKLLDGGGNLVGEWLWADQPSGGIPLGGCRTVHVTPSIPCDVRVVYDLHL